MSSVVPTPAHEERPIDFYIVGYGVPGVDYMMSRHNAGWIFIDYLANCVAMQSYLIENANDEFVQALKRKEEASKKGEPITEVSEKLVPSYNHPTFTRDYSLACDIHDVIFALTAEDLAAIQGSRTPVPKGQENTILKSYRLLLIKPVTVLADTGLAVAAALQKYKIQNLAKQLIVVLDDPTVLPGCVLIQDAKETKNLGNHEGLVSLIKVINTASFFKFRLGIGKPADPKAQMKDHVLGSFNKEDQQEMNMFGFSLDVTAQALQHLACLGDIQKTKKKYSDIKKLPKTLRKMEGLGFPYKVVEVNKPEEKKPEPVAEPGSPKKESAPGSPKKTPASPKKESRPASPVKKEEAPAAPAKKEAAPAKKEEPAKKEAAPAKKEEPAKKEAAPAKKEEPAKKETAPVKKEEPAKGKSASKKK